MASPRRSSAPQVEYGATNNAHHRHQVRLIESSSEDDDDEDEHKLQIDLSSAEDDTSSLESRDHNDDVVPTTAGESSLASESHSNPSNFDPLQSLQMLVRSPFAQGQISSAADASVAKGTSPRPLHNHYHPRRSHRVTNPFAFTFIASASYLPGLFAIHCGKMFNYLYLTV